MAGSQRDLTVSQYYHEAKNEITQPAHFVATSRYFVEHWMRDLAGPAVLLVMALRSLGYYNPLTGELRNGIRIGMKELAEKCGVTDRTLQRTLDTHPYLGYFVRVEASYEQLPDGRIRHRENIYWIAMDDPVHPKHLPALEAKIEERERRDPFRPSPANADGRVKRSRPAGRTGDGGRETDSEQRQVAAAGDETAIQNPKSKIQNRPSPITHPPMNDILSPPPTGHGRHSDTRVASMCRGKDSIDIPNQNILSDILNNNPQGVSGVGEEAAVVVASATLVSDLIGYGVTRRVAEELAGNHSEAEVRQQIEALAFREPKDPAAALVAAIREGWAVPAALLEEKKRLAKQEKARAKSTERRAEETAREADRTEMLQRLEAYWQGLPTSEQTRIEAEARETLRRTNPFVAQLMERAGEGKIVKSTLESLREQILRERMGIKAEVE